MSAFFGFLLRTIYEFVHHYPISIIVLTLVVRTAMLPLTKAQVEYTKKTTQIQPKLQEIQAKYKNDPEKLSAKMNELYKENDVRPIMGCLPLLIQFPIIIGLFNALREPMKHVFVGNMAYESTAALSQPFLWMPNMTNPDLLSNVILIAGVTTILPGILPIISAITTYIQMDMMNKKTKKQNEGKKKQPQNAMADQMGKQMAMMNKIMPFMILFMGTTMPAGLMLYWTVGNIFQIAQQYVMNLQDEKKEAEKAALELAERNNKKNEKNSEN